MVRWLGERGLQAEAFATEFGDAQEDDVGASAAGATRDEETES
jgi:hypothetical protein